MPKKASLTAITKQTTQDRMKKLARAPKKESIDRDNSVFLNTRQPKDLVKKIKVYCAMNDLPMQDFVHQAIVARLKAK